MFDMKQLMLPNDLPEIRRMMEAEGDPTILSMDGEISVKAYEKRTNIWISAMEQLDYFEKERG